MFTSFFHEHFVFTYSYTLLNLIYNTFWKATFINIFKKKNQGSSCISMLYTVSSNVYFNPPETVLQKYVSEKNL